MAPADRRALDLSRTETAPKTQPRLLLATAHTDEKRPGGEPLARCRLIQYFRLFTDERKGWFMAEKQDETKEKKNYDKTLSKREDCIYTVGPNLFMVIAQRRVQGKTLTKKARNVKGIQEARNKRNQFLAYLVEKDRELERGKLTWETAFEARKARIRRKIDSTKNHIKPMGEGEFTTAGNAYAQTKQWSKMLVQEIKTQDVWAIFERASFNSLAYGTKRHHLRHIKAVFKLAHEMGTTYVNVAAGIYVPREDKNAKGNEVVWIRQEVMEKIFDKYHGPNMEPLNKWAAAFYIAYYTGLRSGELYALKWADVHLENPENSYLEVKHTYNWKNKTETKTKSGQSRFVDIAAIKKYLLEHKMRSPEKEFVFARDAEWAGGKAARALIAALKDIDFKPEIIIKDKKEVENWPTFHSLRAAYIMNLLTGKVPHLLVQSQEGHADFKTTKHYIAKLKPEDIKNTSQVLNPFTKKVGA